MVRQEAGNRPGGGREEGGAGQAERRIRQRTAGSAGRRAPALAAWAARPGDLDRGRIKI